MKNSIYLLSICILFSSCKKEEISLDNVKVGEQTITCEEFDNTPYTDPSNDSYSHYDRISSKNLMYDKHALVGTWEMYGETKWFFDGNQESAKSYCNKKILTITDNHWIFEDEVWPYKLEYDTSCNYLMIKLTITRNGVEEPMPFSPFGRGDQMWFNTKENVNDTGLFSIHRWFKPKFEL